MFANLNGTISAWNGGVSATTEVTTPGAVYTGLAINQSQTLLYAANDSAGKIDVFNSSFAPTLSGAFATPAAIAAAGLVPFNVQDIGSNVYVTYAPAGHANQINAPEGHGAVAVFDENGVLEPTKPLLLGGPLASPWGVALAPAGFGPFGGDLLVGEFSFNDSEIDAFNPNTGTFLGTIQIDTAANLPRAPFSPTFPS